MLNILPRSDASCLGHVSRELMGFAGYDVHCRICILKVVGSEFRVCRNEIVGKGDASPVQSIRGDVGVRAPGCMTHESGTNHVRPPTMPQSFCFIVFVLKLIAKDIDI